MREEDIAHVKERASHLLHANVKTGYDSHFGRRYKYVCPSLHKYPWQWFWDSCFHAIALSHLDLDLAKNELINLVAAQDSDGFIGHVVFWQGAGKTTHWRRLQSKLALAPHHSALIQPPVLAQAVQKVYERDQDEAFLLEMFPRLDRYYRWLAANRDPDGDGLISIISNFESGMDFLPVYDEVLGLPMAKRRSWWNVGRKARGLDVSNLLMGRNYNLKRIFARGRFDVEDLVVNCVYAEALHTMARLAGYAKRTQQAEEYTALAQRVERAIVEKCYDDEKGVFFSVSGQDERKMRVLTVASLFPLLLPGLTKEHAASLVLRLQNPDDFWLSYPAPSVAASEVAFDPGHDGDPHRPIWRGPTWINTNWFLVRGLRRHGYAQLADAITEKSLELVLNEGFQEYYNPYTGKGMGARDFGWSTLVIDMV